MLLVRGEGDVVHARAVAAGQGGVVHGLLAVHPRGVRDAVGVLDVLGDAEAQVLEVFAAARDVRGDLVEVVQPDQFAGGVEVVALGEALDVLDLVEELVGEAQRVLHADGVADALGEAFLAAFGAAAQFLVVGLGGVHLGGGLHPVGEGGDGGDRAPCAAPGCGG